MSVRRIRYAPEHPLATKNGQVSEARVVLYDKVGPGPQECYWCRRLVTWQVGRRGNVRDAVTADHLNSDPLDDRPENLVVACGPCNGKRGFQVEDDELFIERQGVRHRAEYRCCAECGASFLTEVSGPQRCCTRSCAASARNRARQKH